MVVLRISPAGEEFIRACPRRSSTRDRSSIKFPRPSSPRLVLASQRNGLDHRRRLLVAPSLAYGEARVRLHRRHVLRRDLEGGVVGGECFGDVAGALERKGEVEP
jgi:hypothetical protein